MITKRIHRTERKGTKCEAMTRRNEMTRRLKIKRGGINRGKLKTRNQNLCLAINGGKTIREEQ
jgi:hypothetical protein